MRILNSMMKIPAVYIAVLLALLMAASGCDAADRPIKIGVIDVKRVIKESVALRKAQAIYLKELDARQVTLKAKEQAVKQLEEELKDTAQELSAEKRTEKNGRLAQAVSELKRLTTEMDEELKKRDSELMRNLVEELIEAVKKFRQKEKYTVILPKDYTIAFDDTVDVTDKIIQLFNAMPSQPAADLTTTTEATASVSAAETSTQNASGIAGYIGAKSVNLRQKPTTDSAILGNFPRNTALTIVGESGDWYRVMIEKKEGYLRRDFVVKGAMPR